MRSEGVTGDVSARLVRWRWSILVSTWWAYAGLYFGRKSFYAVKDAVGRDLGFDEMALGTIGMAYLVAYTVGQFVAASAGQRLGARRLLVAGMALSAAANVVFAVTTSYATFAVVMVVNGLAQATGWATCMGILGQWTTRQQRGTIMGFWSTCYQLGGVMATSWAALWLEHFDWREAFLAGAAVVVTAGLGVLLGSRDKPEDVDLPPLPEETEPSVASQPAAAADSGKGFRWTAQLVTTIALVGVCYAGIKFVRYTIWSWSAYFLANYYQLDKADAAYWSTVFDWGGFLGVLAAGILSDRIFGGRRALLSFLMLAGMTLGCGLLWSNGDSGVVVFQVAMVFVGFMLYGPDSLLSGAGAIDLGSRRAAIAAAGIINGMGSAGAVIQEWGVASLYRGAERQIGPVFAMLFAASALSMAALGVVLVRNRRGISDL